MTTLVTGGAGYIGSHIVYALLDAGREPVVVDDLSTGVRANLPDAVPLTVADAGDAEVVERLVATHEITDCLHFAGSTVVPESVAEPLDYYRNNTCVARNLIEACIEGGVDRFVFSSTAAIYGDLDEIPVGEGAPKMPLNPYGRSKWMVEQILEDTAAAHEDFEYCALRYFNVAGADPEGRTGHAKPTSSTLIKVTTETALGLRECIEIFGTDYPTRDGTGVRDYIHVTDLADAHLAALRYLEDSGDSVALNCGYGRGFSVREVIDVVKQISGTDFEVRETARRPGDPAKSIADPSRIRELLDWEPQRQELEQIVADGLAWERQRLSR